MLYFLSFLAFLTLLLLAAVYYRHAIIPRLPARIRQMFPRLANYAPLSTFQDQVTHGFSSASFDIEANIRDNDMRMGLNEEATREVQEIMRREGVNFDQARYIYSTRRMAKNGIDPTGMPLDPKAITRL